MENDVHEYTGKDGLKQLKSNVKTERMKKTH